MNCACLFHAYKGESDCSFGDSMLAKVVSCAVSVVKANCVQGGATTNCIKGDKYFWATNDPFW